MNYLIKCTRGRCGHVHAESNRVPVRNDLGHTLTCPRCGHDTYYNLKRGARGGMVIATTSTKPEEYLTAPAESDASP